MSVGVMEDYKLRDLRASHTLGWSWNIRLTVGSQQVVYYESMKRKLIDLRASHTLGWSWNWKT
jgi:hypothetical protein